jgi:hypothetical protein
MGRAGPARSSCSFLPSPPRGLSHGPPPRVGELRARVWTPRLFRFQGGERVKAPGTRERRVRGFHQKWGVSEHSPTVDPSEAPPPPGAPPCAP